MKHYIFYELEEGPVKVMDKLRSIYSKDIPIEEKNRCWIWLY